MSRIKRANTKPEIFFRKFIWNAGIRGYRKDAKIIGRPDLLFPKRQLAIFIDGCFWHMCNKCFKAPKTRVAFWAKKLGDNVKRDNKINNELNKKGYIVVRLWEHEVKSNPEKCLSLIRTKL